jgi:glycosyltransferase involved in cell wall biosynthesis
MRVIINAISANTGGIVTYTSNLIQYLGDEEFEAIVYVPRAFDASKISHPKVTVKPVPVKRFYGALHRFIWEQFVWRRIVRESGAEVLYSSANYGVLFPPVPQVLLVQGEIYLNPVYREKVLPQLSLRERVSAFMRRNLMLYSARHSEIAVFPSEVALQAALDYGPDIKRNSVVNYLGVNPRFKTDETRRSWKAEEHIRLLYVSVYYPHKDPVTLAEATRLLCDQGVPAKSRITVEAQDFDPWPSNRSELDALRSDRYSDCLTLGRINHEELNATLSEYDVFVFPSMAETFGFPMIEAMRAGIPLIVSDIPIHHEICGDSALYFELSNSADLAEKVKKLDTDPELRERMVSSGKKRAETMFTWGRHIAQLKQIVSKITGPKDFRLLINGLHARTGGGVTYLHNMLPLLAAEPGSDIHLCAHEDQKDVLPIDLQNVTYHFLNFRRGFWNVLWREQIDLPRLARSVSADVTFSPANYGPILARNPVVMVRNAVSVGFVERRPIKLAYWALLYLATLMSLATSKGSIAVSDYARRVGTGVLWGKLRQRITVVPHGVNASFAGDPSVKRDKNLLLAVSDIYVQKNFTNLILAFTDLSTKHTNLKLKIAGRPIDQQYLGVLRDLIDEKGLGEKVEFLGHLNTDQLRDMYQRCTVFVFPSTVETFGNPLVEAMACGAPIACSNAAAMPEVLGDAGLYFDPADASDMGQALDRFMSSSALREEYANKASERSSQYSWKATQQRTLEVLKLAGR